MPAEIRRRCPVCEGERFSPFLEKSNLQLVRCEACTMIFANPVPDTFASGEYYDAEGSAYYLSPAKLESDYAPVRFERELRFFREHCPQGSVLDVGCSSGAFLFQIKTQFPSDYTVQGTDVSGAPLDYAESRGVGVLRGNFLEMDFGRQRYSAITFWAVLEHLLDPGKFLDQAATLLEPGGVCFVLVPNMQSLAARLLGARYRYIYPQHLNYFTPKTLQQLVAKQWEVLEVRCTHFNPVILWKDWCSHGREVSNTDRADLLRRTTAIKQSRWIGPVKAAYRLSERVLGSVMLADNLALVMKRRDRIEEADGG
jgi:2-polyprenyl-3-methyl-5-hydroxy-6-metoxy-1,4-benzoquinol methylase